MSLKPPCRWCTGNCTEVRLVFSHVTLRMVINLKYIKLRVTAQPQKSHHQTERHKRKTAQSTCVTPCIDLYYLFRDLKLYIVMYVCIYIYIVYGHVARMGEERGVYRLLLGKPEGRNHWGDLDVDEWVILGWISRRWDVGIWTGLGWPRIETGGGRL